jgi:RNA polymerase sigma-70 factor (ECF subfamily)
VPIEAEAAMKPMLMSNTERGAERSELLECIRSAVDDLVASRRPVVRMWLAGFDLTEIMQAFGYSEPKARNLLYRGLADLRARLTELGIGPEALS